METFIEEQCEPINMGCIVIKINNYADGISELRLFIWTMINLDIKSSPKANKLTKRSYGPEIWIATDTVPSFLINKIKLKV